MVEYLYNGAVEHPLDVKQASISIFRPRWGRKESTFSMPNLMSPLRRVLYQCRLPPRTRRTDRWQLHERLECDHLIRVKFDHLGQLTTAARRRCAKCANSLPTDPISDAENETKVISAKEDAMDEKLSSKFRLGMLLADVLELNIDWKIESREALYAALGSTRMSVEWGVVVCFAGPSLRDECAGRQRVLRHDP